MWEEISVLIPMKRNQNLIPYSNSTFYQMKYMFGEAAAFNQRLNFDTAKVMDVREYLC